MCKLPMTKKKKDFFLPAGSREKAYGSQTHGISMGNVGGRGSIESVFVRMVHARALSYKPVNFLF